MAYKLIAFDFDGTLANSFPFFMSVFGSLADAHGFRRVSPEEAHSLRGVDARSVMRHVGLPLWKFPRVALQFKTMMAAQIDSIALFEGVGAMLRALSANGLTLAIVSSNSEENVRSVLGDLSDLISHYACGISVLGKRQHLAQLRKRSGDSAREMLYVGDELRDIEAARAEGIPFGAVAWGYTHFSALLAESPDEAFAQIEDVLARLLIR